MSKPRKQTRKTKKSTPVVRKAGKNGALTHRQWLWLGGFLVLAFVAFSPVLNAEFINYDDDIYVTENLMIRNLNGENLKQLFSTFYYNQYSPVAMLIMALEFKVFGAQPFALKLISILLHLGNAVLVFYFIRRLFNRFDLAIITAALFAVHTLQVESVAWLTASMKIGAYSLFFLGSLLAYVVYLQKKNTVYLFLSLGLFLLSCFSKEQAVALSLVLVAIDYLKGRPLLSRAVLLEKVPFFVISIIFGIVTLSVADDMQAGQSVFSYTPLERIVFASYALTSYLVKTVAPVNLSAFYTYPIKGSIPVFYYLTPLVTLGVLFALYFSWKKEQKVIVFAILFFLLNLALTLLSQVLSVRDVIMADRCVYLPSIGLFLLAAWGIARLIEQKKAPAKTAYGALIVYGLILAGLTFQRAKVWDNSITLFSDVIEKGRLENDKYNPFLALAFTNRGVARKGRGDLDGALADYNQAIASNAAYGKAYLNRGNIYFNAGQTEQAIADYNQSLEYDPDNASTYSSRAAAYGKEGRLDLALADLNQALQLDPNMTDALSNRALVYHQQQQYEPALADIDRFLRISPNDAGMVNFRGLVLMRLNRLQEAEATLTRSIQMDPGNGAYYLNRAYLYRDLGDRARALQDATQAQSLGAQVNQQFLNGLR